MYCANVYLRSVREPPPPSGESFATSELSGGSGRYPYRKAMARINKVSNPSIDGSNQRCSNYNGERGHNVSL